MTHRVVTQDFPENLNGGIMICGINFGFGVEDEKIEASGQNVPDEPSSTFSDRSVNNTRFRNRILRWLESWDIPLSTAASDASPLDRAFFQTNWLDTQTKNTTNDEPITVNLLVEKADSILGLIEQRQPSIVLFVGSELIEALNDSRLRNKVEQLLGQRPGNAQIHRRQSPEGKKQFKILTQKFPRAQIISLPHTQSLGLTDAYMAQFRDLIRPIILFWQYHSA